MTIDLPWTHFSPASMTLHFELSIMIGTLAIAGSAETRLRNRVIACSPSIRPSSMLTSMMLAPALDLLAGDGQRRLVSRRS